MTKAERNLLMVLAEVVKHKANIPEFNNILDAVKLLRDEDEVTAKAQRLTEYR